MEQKATPNDHTSVQGHVPTCKHIQLVPELLSCLCGIWGLS